LYALLLGGLFWLATGANAARLSPGMALLSLLFGLVNYFATTLFAYDTWGFLRTAAAWLHAAWRILLQSTAMAAVFAVVCGWLEGGRAMARAGRKASAAHGRQSAASAFSEPVSVAATRAGTPAPADAPYEELTDTRPSARPPYTAPQTPVARAAANPMQHAAPADTPYEELTDTRPSARPTYAAPQTRAARAAVNPTQHAAPRRRIGDWLAGAVAAVQRRFPRLARAVRRHPTLSTMLWLLVCWAPFLIAFFPGTVIWDMGEMLGGLYGLRDLSTWHPMFTTWLFGGCVWLGRLLGSDNAGAFLFTLLQTLLLAYVLAESVRFLRRLGLPALWRLAALVFFGLSPIFGSFAQAVGKDTLYAAALLLFALRAAEGLRFGALSGKRLWELGVWALLSCLLRSNGLYVVLGTAAVLLPLWLGRRALRPACAALAAALLLAFAFNSLLVPALRINDGTASGLYAVPFQQSARTLRDHAATVTPAEYAEIDRVLDAKNLPDLYEVNIADPVKYTFRQYGQGRQAEAAALARYRQTWLAMAQKYPLTYIEAFVAAGSGYYAFTPKIDAARTYNAQGGIRFVFETYDLGPDPRYLHTAQPAALSGARTLLAAYARGWRRVPVLELFLFCPTYTWLLAAAGFSLLRRGRWREAVAFLPALLSLGVCLLSPVNDYFRYFLPVVAMAPMLLGLAGAQAPTHQPDEARAALVRQPEA
jgi:hypothetical protein